ncbi:MAG: hypothetical protein HYZ37_09205 [Candidatus Solibacter usitatus]|nr:hypothetical protein [Candidatus Solibacter usitatus]
MQPPLLHRQMHGARGQRLSPKAIQGRKPSRGHCGRRKRGSQLTRRHSMHARHVAAARTHKVVRRPARCPDHENFGGLGMGAHKHCARGKQRIVIRSTRPRHQFDGRES